MRPPAIQRSADPRNKISSQGALVPKEMDDGLLDAWTRVPLNQSAETDDLTACEILLS